MSQEPNTKRLGSERRCKDLVHLLISTHSLANIVELKRVLRSQLIIQAIMEKTTNSRFTRAIGNIRQYPRSLIRFCHSPARSLHSHRLWFILLLSFSSLTFFQLCQHKRD